ncbi:hypothetical protein DM01DRAFT_1331008 [Hesseltinella vesiculosa]|uniref:Uncharacterized protein n=1 Tax=Hesseltinella vesiculosa TaxID=101127 RepID=A0A1X2GXT7_9FUNG|nr:hypothetical protein DM01DRAFT_1331008 [Hesseltinella vesiculosa]
MATDRPDYRDPKELCAVKVYTIAQESRHLVMHNIPALSGEDQIIKALLDQLGKIGTVDTWKKQQGNGNYTNSLAITMATIDEARQVKRQWDDQPFYANLLQVFYTPELETLDDLRNKLLDRRTKVQQRLDKFQRKRRQRQRIPSLDATPLPPLPPSAAPTSDLPSSKRRRI